MPRRIFLSGNIFCHESGSFNGVNPFRAFGLRVRTLDHWCKRGNLEAEVKHESYEGPFQNSVENVYWRDRDTIVLEHLMAIYRALGTKYKLSGSSGDWCGIAWNPVEEESGEAPLQQYGGSCE